MSESQKRDWARDLYLEIINIWVAVESMGTGEILERMWRMRRDQNLEQSTQEQRKSMIFPTDPELSLSL